MIDLGEQLKPVSETQGALDHDIRMKGLRPPLEFRQLAEPTLSLDRVVGANPASIEECLVTTDPVSAKQILDGNFPPQNPEFDLQGVPDNVVPTDYEEPLQTLVEGILGNTVVISQELRDRAAAFLESVASLKDPRREDLQQLVGQAEQLRLDLRSFRYRAGGEIPDHSDRGSAVVMAFSQAYRLNPLAAPAPGHSIHYQVVGGAKGRDGPQPVVPESGAQIRVDPILQFADLMVASPHDIKHFDLSYIARLTEELEEKGRIPQTGEVFAGMRSPRVIFVKPVEYPYNPTKGKEKLVYTPDYWAEREGRRNPDILDFAWTVALTADLVLDPNRPETHEQWKQKREAQMSELTGGRLKGVVKRTSGLAKRLHWITRDIREQSTHVKEAIVLATTKALLSGLDPESLDYSRWLIVKPNGELMYMRDALQEYISYQEDNGWQMGAEVGERLLRVMDAWHAAALDAKAQGIRTEEGLVVSSSEIFRPLKLEKGGEWRPVATADTYNVLAEWLASERPFPPDDADTGFKVLSTVFGLQVTPQTTERDLILMSRKAAAALMPIYPGQETYTLPGMENYPQMERYRGYEGVLNLLKDFTATMRVARPKLRELMAQE